MKITSVCMAALAAHVAVATPMPSPASEQAATTSNLPLTVVLLATLANGTVIGSLKGDGNFSNPGPQYPFHSTNTTGIYSHLSAYAGCSVGSGPIDGAIFNCSTGADQSTLGQFYDDSGFLGVSGSGTTFSIDTLPAKYDSVGTPTIIGAKGKWGQFKLQAKYTSG